MPRLSGPEHARNALVARVRVGNFLQTHHPNLVPVHKNFYAAEQGVGADLRHEIDTLAAEETNYNRDSLKDVDRVSRRAVDQLQERSFLGVHATLRSNDRTEPHAASFLSQATQHSAKWLTSTSSFVHNGALHLLMRPSSRPFVIAAPWTSRLLPVQTSCPVLATATATPHPST